MSASQEECERVISRDTHTHEMRRPPLSEKYDMDFLNEELPRRENSFAVDAVML